MKTISTYLFLILFTLTFISCEKEKEHDPILDPNTIEFDNLEVGDIMLYSYLTGNESFDGANSEVIYTGDTLELEVIDKVDGKYLIQEQITSGSAIFDSEDKYIWGAIEEATELLWDIREDSIIITTLDPDSYRQSQILFGRYWFSLKEVTENKIEFDGWKTSQPTSYNGYEYFIENGVLHGITYPYLNATLISFSPVDADATTHIYNKENGFVRTNSISPWTSMVRGWDRIN